MQHNKHDDYVHLPATGKLKSLRLVLHAYCLFFVVNTVAVATRFVVCLVDTGTLQDTSRYCCSICQPCSVQLVLKVGQRRREHAF